MLFDLKRQFDSYRLISVVSSELGIELSEEELAPFKPYPNKGYLVGSRKLPRNRKAKGILVKKEGLPLLNYSVSYVWQFESAFLSGQCTHIVDYQILPKKPIPQEYGNLFTDDHMLWNGFADFDDGGGCPDFLVNVPNAYPSLSPLDVGVLAAKFTLHCATAVWMQWTPKSQELTGESRIKEIKSLYDLATPIMVRSYFPMSWGSWRFFQLKEEKYPTRVEAITTS